MRLRPARIRPISQPFLYHCFKIASIKSTPYDLDSVAPKDHKAKSQMGLNDSSLNFEYSVAHGVQDEIIAANGRKDLHLHWPLLQLRWEISLSAVRSSCC